MSFYYLKGLLKRGTVFIEQIIIIESGSIDAMSELRGIKEE